MATTTGKDNDNSKDATAKTTVMTATTARMTGKDGEDNRQGKQ
jgi:hypothetical protein